MLKDTFQELTRKYITDSLLTERLWNELENSYSHRGRHYHTLSHLEHMLSELMPVQTKINDWDTIRATLFYHDIIYQPTSKYNEEKSAELAEARLIQLNFPSSQIEKCKQTILATKTHVESTDIDINYFTDADLCILGQSWETYLTYAKNVRKEYSIYPDFIYYPGRKKVLTHFLDMPRIFKTVFFFDKFEEKARKNLNCELNMV